MVITNEKHPKKYSRWLWFIGLYLFSVIVVAAITMLGHGLVHWLIS